MDAKGLASLRKEFSALLKLHDGASFRFIVEMVFHSEELEEESYDPVLWKAAERAVCILEEARADMGDVYQWGMRGPDNSRAVRDIKFLTEAQL
jgi:hypothetical protein